MIAGLCGRPAPSHIHSLDFVCDIFTCWERLGGCRALRSPCTFAGTFDCLFTNILEIGVFWVVSDGVDVEDDGEDGGGEPADWPGKPDAAGAAEGGEDV